MSRSSEDQKPSAHATTDAGIAVASDEHSLTIGADGPIVLHDHYLIEQMANFNRERIPERQPHAKGGGAFGHFEVTQDVSAYTRAAVFQPGTKTDTLIRFSTVARRLGISVLPHYSWVKTVVCKWSWRVKPLERLLPPIASALEVRVCQSQTAAFQDDAINLGQPGHRRGHAELLCRSRQDR